MEEQRKDPYTYARDFSRMEEIDAFYLIRRDLPKLVRQFIRGTKMLDYGCGSGKFTHVFKSLGLDVEGVDINEHMITFAKEHDPSGKYYVIESAQIPAKANTYDLVYGGNVLPYASSKDDMLKIVKDVVRVLKPGGIFLALNPNKNTYKYKWLHTQSDFEENKSPTSGSVVKFAFKNRKLCVYHYYWTREDYEEVFAKAGLTLMGVHEPLGNSSDGLPWVSERDVAIVTFLVTKKL